MSELCRTQYYTVVRVQTTDVYYNPGLVKKIHKSFDTKSCVAMSRINVKQYVTLGTKVWLLPHIILSCFIAHVVQRILAYRLDIVTF